MIDLSVIQSSTLEKIFSIKNINAEYPLPCLYALAGRMNVCLALAIKNPAYINDIVTGLTHHFNEDKLLKQFLSNPDIDLSLLNQPTLETLFKVLFKKNIDIQYPLPCLYALAGRMNVCLTLAIKNPACINDIITGLTQFSDNHECLRRFLENPDIDLSLLNQPTLETLFKVLFKKNIDIQYPLPCLYALAGRMNVCLTLAIENPACINDIITGLTQFSDNHECLRRFLENPDIDLSFISQQTLEILLEIFHIKNIKYPLVYLYLKLKRYKDCFRQIKSTTLCISECIQAFTIINKDEFSDKVFMYRYNRITQEYTPTNQEIKDLFSQILNDTDIDLSLIDPSTCKAMIQQLGERTCIDILLNCSHPNLTYIYGLLGRSKECLNAIENNTQSINAVIQGIIAGNHETLFFNIFANPNIDLSQIDFSIQQTILKQFNIIETPYHEICLHAVLGRYEYCVNQAKENPACIQDILISFINSNRKDCLINFLEEPTIDFSCMDVSIQKKILLKLSNNPNSRQAQFLISFIKRYNTFFDIGLSSIKILTEESQSSNDQVFINAFFKQYRYCIEKTAMDSSLIQDTIMGFLAGNHLKLLEQFLINIDNNFSCIDSSIWNTLAAVINLDYTIIIGKCVRSYPDEALQLIESLPIIILEKIDIQQFFEQYISRISSELKMHPILESIAHRFLSSKKLDLAEKYAQFIPDTPANEDLMQKKLELLEIIQDHIPDSWETGIDE